jgi:SAM-dependent methyltransferase
VRWSPEFGVEAAELGWVPSPSFVLRRAAVLERIDAWAPGRALEVGCGAGALFYDLSLRGFTGVAVESAPGARALAQRLLADQTGVSVAAEAPAEPEAFDYLLSFEVLEHIEQDGAALSAWVQQLRPGGRCLLSVPAHSKKWNLTDTLAGHFRRYDRADVEQLVRSAGLRIDRLETIGFPATWVIERARLLATWSRARSSGIDPALIARGDAKRTQQSGVERKLESRLFPIYGSAPGRWLFRGAARAQALFAQTDWGLSYLVSASK